MEQPQIHLAVLLLELHIPDAQSLKQKRQVVNQVRDKLRSKFNVSVAELDFLDKWQRSIVGITMIANEYAHVDRTLKKAEELVESINSLTIIDRRLEYL